MKNIFIPTYKRDEVRFLRNVMHPELKARIVLVVQECDKDRLNHVALGVDRVVLPPEINNISLTRTWIGKYAAEQSLDYHYQIDDDLIIHRRVDPDDMTNVKLIQKVDEDQVNYMFEELDSWFECGDVKIAGVSLRQGNQNQTTDKFKEIGRQSGFHIFHTETYNNMIHGRVKMMEDFDIVLQYVTKGLPNRLMYDYCVNQPASNSKGGCSEQRSLEIQNESAEKMGELWPEWVTVVEKDGKSGWFNGKPRKDVRIQWKKVYESSVRVEPTPAKDIFSLFN